MHLAALIARRGTRLLQNKSEDELQTDPYDEAIGKAVQARFPSEQGTHDVDEAEKQQDYRCANLDGFSLHANVAIAARDKEARLRIVRYGARQSFSQKQLSLLSDGRVRYDLKRPWGRGGATDLTLTPTEFLHRLAALIPPPYLHLTRYSGIFGALRNHTDAALLYIYVRVSADFITDG